jgi:mono/diheme cytochrome c family protein
MKTRNISIAIIVVGLVLFVVIQLVPYGKNHANPAVVSEPNWDSQQTRDLAQRACFDCHSNETVWPWYSNIAPVSWLVYHDVEEGRNQFNFSDWQNSYLTDAGEFSEVISEGEMPPFQYLLMHSNAKLTDAEKQQLITGLQKTLGQ